MGRLIVTNEDFLLLEILIAPLRQYLTARLLLAEFLKLQARRAGEACRRAVWLAGAATRRSSCHMTVGRLVIVHLSVIIRLITHETDMLIVQCFVCDAGCDSNEFQCPSGQCIPSSDVCNGADDCGDNGDELGCVVTTTAPGTAQT